uniref:GRF-type domain-containing protein n=1 Tax=Nicotiana tabacum TaxID=4097 RepID=A0A1S4AQY7_TOBAC|nr:PREDICTED: uncharacterized protein LOC107800353 [Nicotiana tabacum]
MKTSSACSTLCSRDTKKRLTISPREPSTGKMLFLTFTRNYMRPQILIRSLLQLLGAVIAVKLPTFTSTTILNPGRRFYKCPKRDFGQVDSCGYWEWHDEVLPDRALVVISNIKAQLDVATVKVSNLSSALDAVKIERVNLKEKVNIMEAINNYQVIKSRDLEEKLRKMKMCFLASCALFVGFVAALLMK